MDYTTINRAEEAIQEFVAELTWPACATYAEYAAAMAALAALIQWRELRNKKAPVVPTHYSCAFIIWPDGRRELRPICHVQGAQKVSAELAEVDCLECLRVVGERMRSE